MAGPGICVLCLADTCTSEVHPVFNPVAPYGYLLSDMYLFMADITNPDFLVLSCRTWIGLDITRFCEQQRQPSSGSAWPACQKNGKSGPHCWGRGGSTQFAQQHLLVIIHLLISARQLFNFSKLPPTAVYI